MNNLQEKISIKPLIWARNFLADIVQDAQSNYEKAGVVKAFEVCFELTYPVLRKVMKRRGIQVPTPVKEVFRKAGEEGLIDDMETWLEFKDYSFLWWKNSHWCDWCLT